MPSQRPRPPRVAVDALRTALDPVRGDRVHGATELARWALDALGRLAGSWSPATEADLPRTFRRIAQALERAQPAMGGFRRWAGEWRRMAGSQRFSERAPAARAWIRNERARLRDEVAGLSRTSRRRFPKARHVVTLSRSQSVLEALVASGRRARPDLVSVLESRPGGEGRDFARDLRRAGFTVQVVLDRDGPSVVASADLLLLGADAVDVDGSVVHKVHTRPLAEAAVHAGVPVVVVAGRSKFSERAPLARPLPSRFDRTPARYVSEYWTDHGVRRGRRTKRSPARGFPH
jgi:translation initiation factor 2B subunit (eIF-2B alpha/beta/delta family)